MEIKFKHVLIVFLLGMILTGIGAFLKIMSYAYGSETLLSGNILYGIAALTLVIKLIWYKDQNSILNK